MPCFTLKLKLVSNILWMVVDSIKKLDYPLFESIFIDVFNTHAPVKTKTMRANNHQFTTKALRKAIMTRSRFKKCLLENSKWKEMGKIKGLSL